ncbi:hypothetical protein C7H79_11490 [Nitrosomonas supralitoralis]|uniref:Response regulatory domain-containing protein n=1 Tax=Nitrosomonas supralitoralis TaxID=2116706 RepID=A0A2P7NTN9_9PROT|nr:hypothetical protein C7H79_11490 [Nitrosomonas supralitoralis]
MLSAYPPILLVEDNPLDVDLPHVDGVTVLQTLKSLILLRHIPVVVLTASKEDRNIKAAYDLGVNSNIVKPVGFDDFMDVAQQIELY